MNASKSYYTLFGESDSFTATRSLQTGVGDEIATRPESNVTSVSTSCNSIRSSCCCCGNHSSDDTAGSVARLTRNHDVSQAPSGSSGGTMDPKKLFVGNLSAETTLKELIDLFSKHGEVNEKLSVVKDGNYAFIHFFKESDAERARVALNDSFLNNRYIRVMYSLSQGHMKKPPKASDKSALNNLTRSTSLYSNVCSKKSSVRTSDWDYKAPGASLAKSNTCMFHQDEVNQHQGSSMTTAHPLASNRTLISSLNVPHNQENQDPEVEMFAKPSQPPSSFYTYNHSQSVYSINSMVGNGNQFSDSLQSAINRVIQRPIRGGSSLHINQMGSCRPVQQHLAPQPPPRGLPMQINTCASLIRSDASSSTSATGSLMLDSAWLANSNELSSSLLIPANSEFNKRFQLEQLAQLYQKSGN